MNAKPKVKPKCVGMARSVILLLVVVLLSSSGISRGGVSPFDPNFTPTIIPQPLVPQPIVPPITPLPAFRLPADGGITDTSPLLIWPSVKDATSYNVYLGTSLPLKEENRIAEGVSQVFLVIQGGELGTTYYWRVDWSADNVSWHEGMVWDFQVGSQKALDPDPADGAENVNLPLLQWTAGEDAVLHNVYYGDDLELVTEAEDLVLVAQGSSHNFYFPGSDFRAGVTYYWKVDEVTLDGTVNPGEVWSFTTKAEKPAITYPEPVAWWPFDENEGTIAFDAVKWREGYIEGTVSWTVGAPGPNGAALDFDGFGTHVSTPFVRSPADGSLGVFCWIRGTSPGGVIVAQQGGLNWLMIDNSYTLVTELPDGTPFSSNRDISMNEWHYVGVTWDGENLALYIDNVQVAGNNYTPKDREGLPNGLYIGGGANLEPNLDWTGYIDDVQIYTEERNVRFEELNVLKMREFNILRDGYYTGSDTLAPVKIDLNFDKALAAVLRYGATRPEAVDFAARLGLEVADFDEPNRIVTLRLPYDTSRADVAKFAGAARQFLSGSPFVEIGLALNPPLADTSILVNDEVIVRFEREMTDDQVIALTDNAVEIVEQNPFEPNEYLLRVDRNAGVDALYVANRYHENLLTVYGVPNLAIVPEFRGYTPNDPCFPEQWHLHSGDGNGTPPNAGVSADEAWGLGYKGDGVIIAVIDSIVDSGHPDLADNLWKNPGEYGKKENYDDDDNGYIDDIYGCDFGYSDDSEKAHGTAVAGCIGAKMDNNIGISGSCPNAQLMLLRCNIWTYDQHLAFHYARTKGADVICCAWGYRHGIPVPQNIKNAIYWAARKGRDKLGCVIVFAMTNDEIDNSGSCPDISALPEVIAVSGATDEELCSGYGFGACLDVLAPTSGGTRSIVTTDVRGNDGYNPGSVAGSPPADLNDPNYTRFFGGTSAACATTAGVAGLVLSANQNLTRIKVQQILQEMADKIDGANANYDSAGHSCTHGYGRINAFKAVSAALEPR